MTDYTVTRRSIDKIEEIAAEILAECPRLASGAIDILTALRSPEIKTVAGKKTLRLTLVPDELLPTKLAQMWAGRNRVTITARMSLWNKAEKYDPDASKDLRHEYSHAVLHSAERTSSAVTLNRQLGGNTVHRFIDEECRAENQADWLAACLAMPRTKIKPEMDVRDVGAEWNVPLKEAQWRLERVRITSPKRTPEAIRRNLEALKTAELVPSFAQTLWDKLPLAPDWAPSLARLANGYLVEYSHYRRYTQTGWAVEGNRVVPLMLTMQG